MRNENSRRFTNAEQQWGEQHRKIRSVRLIRQSIVPEVVIDFDVANKYSAIYPMSSSVI